MALKLLDNKYLVIDKDGNYIIYKDQNTRNTNKSGPSVEKIINKYNSVIDALVNDEQRRYYDYVNWEKEYLSWVTEFQNYIENVRNGINTDTYPLMQKYIKKINNSIPLILSSGNICLKTDTTEEMYNKEKELKVFGETEDV